MKERTDAAGWLYERAELCGIELWGTGAKLDHSTVPKEYHCYDLYSIGETQDERNLFISRKPVGEESCVGAVLTRQPLPFQEKESLSMLGVHYFEEEPMESLEGIMGHAALEGETMGQAGPSIQNM